MVTLHTPTLAGWICAVAGILFVVVSMHGISAPRPWLEWTERRFAYAMRLRFVGGGLLLLAGGAIFLLPADGSLVAQLALGALPIFCGANTAHTPQISSARLDSTATGERR